MLSRKFSSQSLNHGRRRPKNECCLCILCQKFMYTKSHEKLLLIIGILFATAAGICLSLITLIFSDIVLSFVSCETKDETLTNRSPVFFRMAWLEAEMRSMYPRGNCNDEDFAEVAEKYAIMTSCLGVAVFVFTFVYTFLFNYVAKNQLRRIKVRYLSALLCLVIDSKVSASEVIEKMQMNVKRFLDSTGDHFGSMILGFSSFVSALATAFAHNVFLTLMLLALNLLAALILLVYVLVDGYLAKTEDSYYQIAENLARDVFLNIQMVKANGGEKTEVQRFGKLLVTSQTAACTKMIAFGVMASTLYVLLYASYALTFWEGPKLTRSESEVDTPNVLIVVNFCMQICFVNCLKVPILYWISKHGSRAFKEMYATMREAEMENERCAELKYYTVSHISFRSVSFDYADRIHERPLLNDVTVQIPPYTLTAVVGSPRSGKTTFLKFLVKMNLVTKGTVFIGDWNILDLDSRWLRNHIGFVQQRTALFGETINDAVRGDRKDLSDANVVDACRMVNVHSYIVSLHKRYDAALSSDLPREVKEKLAIARVLIRNPDVLILDDCMSELNIFTQMAIISEFLALGNKTVIVTTDKIDIMKTSDLVIHLNDGTVESGNFGKLMSGNTVFKSLVKKSENEKMVIGFENGMVEMSGRSRTREHIGWDMSEIKATEVSISTLPNLERRMKMEIDKSVRTFTGTSVSTWKVLALNRHEFPHLITASIAAAITGFSIPAYASLFGETLGTMVLSSKKEIKESIEFYPQMFLVAGLISGIARVVESYMVAVACSKLTSRLRKQIFEALVMKEISYFDKEENRMEALLDILGKETKLLPLMGAPELTLCIKWSGIIIISALASVYYSWRLGLLTVAFLPFFLTGLYYLSHYQDWNFQEKRLGAAYKFSEELLKHRDTIRVLNMSQHYVKHYNLALSKVKYSGLEDLKVKGILSGYSQSVPFFAYAACMFYGGVLLRDDKINIKNFFKVLESLILGTLLLGQILMILPSRWSYVRSSTRLWEMLPEISYLSKRNKVEKNFWITNGNVKMKHVAFVHPYREQIPRLYDLNLQVDMRQPVVALVGLLNSGNSIPIKLLLRFYTASSGSIYLDDLELYNDIPVRALRRSIGYVDGNDKFFRRTVARNIAYSLISYRNDYEPYVGMDDIITVAKEAGIHNYIITLPDGYYTIMTDDIRNRMTPGQILRLSLAKALLRGPPFLVIENIGLEMDEDAQLLMETAIAKVSFTRTVILASNYLVSVANLADCVYFFQNGHVKEFGIHQKLMEKKGPYFKLFEEQRDHLKRIRDSQHAQK